MNVILCGFHWTGCKSLEILQRMGHSVFVFTHKAPYHIPSLIDYCQKKQVPYSLENISKVELPFLPDIICSIYYRYIIKNHVIESCKGKIFNLHPSLLPNYRGCSSLTWALINGEKKAGFTYHYINEGTDLGDIILQKSLKIEEFDTQETLFLRTMFESIKKFHSAFQYVANGKKGKKQVGSSSYYPRGCPHDGKIELQWDKSYIERFIRAMIYPPYPVAKLNGKDIFTIHDLDNQ